MTLVKAQYYPISMEEKLEHSSLIIEGKVVNKVAFRHDNHIYTKNQIEVIRTVKGDVIQGEFVVVITSGGTMDDVTETWTHMPELTLNQHSFFFLRPASKSMYSELKRSNAYEIYSGVQGIYSFSKDIRRTIYSTLESYRDIEHFYQKIGIPEYAEYSSPEVKLSERNSPGDTCIVYNLRPVGNTFSNTTATGERVINIQLDLFIKVTAGSFRLYNANLETYYNTAMFGSNVVANGKISAVKSAAFNSKYTLTLTDEASDKIKINLLGTTINAASLQQIDTGYKYVARFTLEITGWDGNSPLEWDELTIENDKYSVEGTNVIRNFGCEKLEVGVNCGMEITSITSLAAAGVGLNSENNITGIVEITGENFLDDDVIFGNCTKPEGHRVKFRTINNGWISPLEGDYLEYTNTKIRVKVPSVGYKDNSDELYSGSEINDGVSSTDEIRVCRDGIFNCGCYVTSDEELYIPFSARNTHITNEDGCKESIKYILQDLDDAGGYTWRFDQNFSSKPGAVDAFKRALSTWRCTTKVNFKVDDINAPSEDNGICVVIMESLPVGTSGATQMLSIVTCSGTGINSPGRFKLAFNSNMDWHTGTDMPDLNWDNPNLGKLKGDIESTALHELGHAHLLLHTSNISNVMVRPSPIGYRRILSTDDISGGNHLSLLGNNTVGCQGRMELILTGCNLLSSFGIDENNLAFNVYPNPTKNIVFIEQNFINLKNDKIELEIFNNLGEKLESKSFFDFKNSIVFDLSNYSNGLYYIRIHQNDILSSYTIKIIKL